MSQTNITRLLDAVEAHVVFDGWSDTAFAAAVEDSGLSMDEARLACPRGAVDLAVAYHKAGDAEMSRRLAEIDLGAKRYRDRVALAIQFRLEVVDREMVRRGMTLFSLPHMAPEGARLMWGTADAIWAALGDTSQD
jgi:ubiquinone biosynthesis protein COQ9